MLTQDQKDQIREIVRHHVDDALFSDLCDKFGLKHGDIDPLDHVAVGDCVDRLAGVALRFVDGNMEDLPYVCGSCEHEGNHPKQKEPNQGFETFYYCEKCGYEVTPET